jgi:ribosomal-protein-alanine N-acetyltransferase
MIVIPEVRLALPGDAMGIAQLSRDSIEHGLPWRWTPTRVMRAIDSKVANVAVVRDQSCVLAFGIMEYGDETAHLALLGVRPEQRSRGLGRAVVLWLEACAVTAGIALIRLEARADNPKGIAFYEKLGYRVSGRVSGYYSGLIDAIRLEKRLRDAST